MLPSALLIPRKQPEPSTPRPAKSRHIRAALLTATVVLLSSATLPAKADVIGAIVGGAVGSQFGKGNGRIASAAIGAVIGDRISGSDRGWRGGSVYENQGYGVYGNTGRHGGYGDYGHGHGAYGYGPRVYGHRGHSHGHRHGHGVNSGRGYGHGHHRHLHSAHPVEYVHPATSVYGVAPVIIVPAPLYGGSASTCVVPPGDYPNGVICQPQGMQGIPPAGQPGVPLQPGSPGIYGVQPNGYRY